MHRNRSGRGHQLIAVLLAQLVPHVRMQLLVQGPYLFNHIIDLLLERAIIVLVQPNGRAGAEI